MSFVCFTPYILGYIASFFNYFLLFQLLIRIVNCQLKNNIPNEAGRPGWDGLFMID